MSEARPERIVLIVNPTSTRVHARVRARAEAALDPLGLAEVLATRHAGHGGELAADAAGRGATLVVVLGGDGTVSEVAGALAGGPVGLAILPAGSTNVFARALGWPHPVDRALPRVVQTLRAPLWRTVRLGHVDAGAVERLFCVNAGVGVDADVVHIVEARPWLKTRFRHGGFAAATAAAAARAARHAPTLTVRVDGGEPQTFTSLSVACGAPYAYLGSRPLDLLPGADFGPRLRWLGLRSARLPAVAGTIAGALRSGRHQASRAVGLGWADREVTVDADRAVAVQADGEPLGWHTRVRFCPGPALRVLVPDGRAKGSRGDDR